MSKQNGVKKGGASLPVGKVKTTEPKRLPTDEDFRLYLKERAQLQLDKRINTVERSLSLRAAQDQLFIEEFKAMAEKVFKNKIVAKHQPRKSNKPMKRILNLLLSDDHVGANLDGRELPRGFGPVEQARRLAKVFLETASYKTQYRDNTKLNVYLTGDMIEGLLLHDIREGAPLTEQCVAFMKMFAQAFAFLSTEFPLGITVYCQPGNHGRMISRHPDRATFQKWDSIENILYWALKLICEPLKNVKFEIPFTPYCAVPLFDNMAFITHGDTCLNFGNPSRSINVKSIEAQISKINASKRYGHHFKLFAGGHVHVGLAMLLDGCHLIINPALVPANGHALNFNYDNGNGQTLWESVERYAFGDYRLITVGEAEDKDSSLDSLIQPVLDFA